MKTQLQILLLTFSLLGYTGMKAQMVQEIDLPDMVDVTSSYYGKSDSISVMWSSFGKMYIRNHSDSIWQSIPTAPFTDVSALSVDGSNIYVFGETAGVDSLSGILKSTDRGLTWTRLLTKSFIQSHYIFPDKFCCNDYYCFWYDGSYVKRCSFGGVVSNLSNNLLLPLSQLEVYNGNVYYATNNNSNGSIINGGGYKSTGSTNPSVVGVVNAQQPVYFYRGNEMLAYDRANGKIYVSIDNGSSYNSSNTGFSSDNQSQIKLISSHGYHYMLRNDGGTQTLYFISSVQHPELWNPAYQNVNWDSYPLPLSTNAMDLLEVLPTGELVLSGGALFKYNPQSHGLKVYSYGIKEANVRTVCMNKHRDFVMNANNNLFYKDSNNNQYKYICGNQKAAISDQGSVYLLGDNGFLLKSTDSANSFTSVANFLPYSEMISSGDSLLVFSSNGLLASYNDALNFQTIMPSNVGFMSTLGGLGSTTTSRNRKNQFALVFDGIAGWSYLTHDFGQTWDSTSMYWMNGNYSANFAIDDSHFYYIDAANSSTNFLKIKNELDIVVDSLIINSSDSIIAPSIWAEDGYLYISFINNSNNLNTLQIYRSILGNPTPILWYSTPINPLPYNSSSYAYNNYFSNWEYSFPLFNNGDLKVLGGAKDKLYVIKSDTIYQNIPSNQVTGKVYIDYNGNNTFDTGEALSNPALMYTSAGIVTSTQADGTFAFHISSSNDTLRVNTPTYYSASPSYRIVNNGDSAQNFALTSNQIIEDLSLNIFSSSTLRAGRKSNLHLICRNIGTKTIHNIQLKLAQSNVTLINCTPVSSSIINDTIIWNIDSIQAQQNKVFTLLDSVFVSQGASGIANFYGSLQPSNNDATPNNNTKLLQLPILNSWDPNDKLVEPSDYTLDNLTNHDAFTYTIRFQNTGNADALNIVVVDTLDASLNINTLQVLSASHNYTLQIKPNQVLEFQFNNINLPDSNSNELMSHGFIQFSIQPISTWNLGESIENTAHIYFDFNAPVATNTVSNILSSTVGLSTQQTSSTCKIYPNPFSDFITIKNASGSSIEIYNLEGALILKKQLIGNDEKLPLNNLSEGMYLLKLRNSEGAVSYQKITK